VLDHDGVFSTHSGNDILLSKGVSSSDLHILIKPSSEEKETAISIAVSTIADNWCLFVNSYRIGEESLPKPLHEPSHPSQHESLSNTIMIPFLLMVIKGHRDLQTCHKGVS